MYLKSIEMQGFKSFADKTKVIFDQGVTAVVGLGIVGVVLPGWIRRRKQGQFYE